MIEKEDADSIIALLRESASLPGVKSHILSANEVEILREIIDDFQNDVDLRRDLKDLSKITVSLKEVVETYKTVQGFIKVVIAARNIILVVMPIAGVWAALNGWISLNLTGSEGTAQ